jgi:hypothetical protein
MYAPTYSARTPNEYLETRVDFKTEPIARRVSAIAGAI